MAKRAKTVIIDLAEPVERDERYETVQQLILAGRITRLRQIWKKGAFPMTLIANILNTNTTRLRTLEKRPEYFTFHDIVILAYYFQVPFETMYMLFVNEVDNERQVAIVAQYIASKGKTKYSRQIPPEKESPR